MTLHKCRTCGNKWDCGHGSPCSSRNIDCELCYADYEKMGCIDNLIDKRFLL